MSIAELDNLVKIRKLATEPRNETEIQRLLRMAQMHLTDAQQPSVSVEGRYLSAYAAGHSAGLAVLRHHGYRSENRYIVFQSPRIRSAGPQSAGACLTRRTAHGTWRSTKGLWRLSSRR